MPMRYLLDTHTYLWVTESDSHLSRSVREAISNEDNDVFLSIASLWEIAIKASLDKLHLDSTFMELAIELPIAFGLKPLEITPHHLDIVSRLPFHHRDPFDRLLIAQCIAESMALISRDSAVDDYGIERESGRAESDEPNAPTTMIDSLLHGRFFIRGMLAGSMKG